MKRLITLLVFGMVAFAQTAIQYTDMVSAPIGAIVSVYGLNLGSSQGTATITLAGSPVTVALWTPTQISFVTPSTPTTGNIVVSTATGSLPLTVRAAGIIHYVAITGLDTNPGTISAPWATLSHAVNSMAPGDVTYAMNGVTAATPDLNAIGGYDQCLQINQNLSGTNGLPKALLAYPNALVVLGQNVSNPPCTRGAMSVMNTSASSSTPVSDWVVGGLNFLGGNAEGISIQGWGLNGAQRIRIIATQSTCPWANGADGCNTNFNATGTVWYGNNIHNVSTSLTPGTVTALQHGFYLGDSSSAFDFEYNTIANVNACRGFQQNSSVAGDTSYSVVIANNLIHDTACNGIVYVNMDASKGTGVQIFNNTLYNIGIGPAPPDGGNFAGAYLQTWSVTANGVAQVYNNTIYNCGTVGGVGSSQCFLYWPASGFGTVNFYNNLIDSPNNSTSYIGILTPAGSDATTTSTTVGGKNNLMFGQGAPPAYAAIIGTVNVDPQFVNAPTNLTPQNPLAAGIGAQPVISPPPPVTSVVVSPAVAYIVLGNGGVQFTAVSTGIAPGVTWSVSGPGKIKKGGYYVAPSSITKEVVVTITATSMVNSLVKGTAIVNLGECSCSAGRVINLRK